MLLAMPTGQFHALSRTASRTDASPVIKPRISVQVTSKCYTGIYKSDGTKPARCSTAATSFFVTGTSIPCRAAPRRIGPAIASSSGVLPCSTSFCMELRMFPGIFTTAAITASASIFAAFGIRHRAGLADAGQSQLPPGGIGEDFARGFAGGGCRERERRQKNQLAPHERRLVLNESARETHPLQVVERGAKQSSPGRRHIQIGKGRAMDDVSGRDAFGLDGNRRGNDAGVAIARTQQREMVDAIEQGNDGAHCLRLRERCQGRFQLRGFHRNPENIGGRNVRGARNGHSKVSERAFELKFRGIVGERLGPHHHGDRGA